MTNTMTIRDQVTGNPVTQQVFKNPDGSILPIQSSVQLKWRTDFSTPGAIASKWDVFQVGSGMAYAGANGLLTLTTGTTLDDELVFLSKESFTVPIKAMVALNMSQRIVGQNVMVELVSVDPVTGLPDDWAAMAWRLDAASVTQGIYEVATGGQPRLLSAVSTIPTTANTTYASLELEAFADEAWFHGRPIDSAAQRANSYVRHQQIPDPDRLYKLRLKAKNRQVLAGITAVVAGTASAIRITRTAHGYTTGDNVTVDNLAGVTGTTFPWSGSILVVDANNIELTGTTFAGTWVNTGWSTISKNVGPATSTTVNFNFATVLDYVELTAEITAGRGNSSAGQGIAANVVNTPAILSGVTDNGTGSPFNNALVRSAVITLTAGRVSGGTVTLGGAAVNKPFAVPELDWQFASATGGIVNTTAVAAKAAGAAGIRNYVTGLQLQNQHATVGTEFVVLDGASTVIFRTYLPPVMNVPVAVTFPTPLRGTAAAALQVACITTGAQVHCSVQGYQAP